MMRFPTKSIPGRLDVPIELKFALLDLRRALEKEIEAVGVRDDDRGRFISAAIQSLKVADYFLRAAERTQLFQSTIGDRITERDRIAGILKLAEISNGLNAGKVTD